MVLFLLTAPGPDFALARCAGGWK